MHCNAADFALVLIKDLLLFGFAVVNDYRTAVGIYEIVEIVDFNLVCLHSDDLLLAQNKRRQLIPGVKINLRVGRWLGEFDSV